MRQAKASFTVEISLLMIIILPVLFGIIYMGFYLHNNALMKNAAYEIAIYAELAVEGEQVKIMEAKKEEVLTQRLIAAKDVDGSIVVNNKEVLVTLTGKMDVPGLVLKLFVGKYIDISGSSVISRPQAGKTVVAINSLKKVIEGVRK